MPTNIGCAFTNSKILEGKAQVCVHGTTTWAQLQQLEHDFIPVTPHQAYGCYGKEIYQTTSYLETVTKGNWLSLGKPEMELEAHVIATYLFPEKDNVKIAQYKLTSKLDTDKKTRFYVPGNKNLFGQV